MENRKILVGIVTYNPNIERLKCNISAVLNQQIEQIVIIDNGSDNVSIIKNIFNQKCYLIENEENKGIAYALNQIGKYAEDNHYRYFLTLDQDSIIDENFVIYMQSIWKEKNVGMVCPYINRNGDYIQRDKIQEVKFAITSGSMVLTEAWRKVGGFWEYLFIDEVDHEFCYRLRKNSFRIVQTDLCSIEHIIGCPQKKVVLGHEFSPTNHSAIRRFYMTRNSLIILYLYSDEKEPFPHRLVMLFRIFVSIVFCEEDKLKKCWAMIRGIFAAAYWILRHPNRQV